jgi:hypothetical protein
MNRNQYKRLSRAARKFGIKTGYGLNPALAYRDDAQHIARQLDDANGFGAGLWADHLNICALYRRRLRLDPFTQGREYLTTGWCLEELRGSQACDGPVLP